MCNDPEAGPVLLSAVYIAPLVLNKYFEKKFLWCVAWHVRRVQDEEEKTYVIQDITHFQRKLDLV